LTAAVAASQTTQGLIAGRLLDSRTGRPISGGHVSCAEDSTGTRAEAVTDGDGFYALPLVPPALYSIRATATAYQSQEAQDMELTVAGRLDLNFLMRPLNDVWEAGLYRSVFLPGAQTVVTFYGPDVDASHSGNFEGLRGQQGALESTVSDVIEPLELESLPLAGRDVYALLFTLPAVTSDGGVSRGLGLSVNGQRPSSSNYLLDGVENNNYLVTGPLTPIAPEAIQEYRISESSYSAQYGRTAGFVANAITRSGTNQWHGVGYVYFRNEILDANSFQRNLQGLGRPRDHELRPGFQVGGPIWRNRLYVSAAYERFQGRQRQDPETLWLPTPALAASLPSGSVAGKLLTQFPTPFEGVQNGPCSLTTQSGCYAPQVFQPPVSLNQSVSLVRADYSSPGGAHHVTGRVALTYFNRPDFLWSPYKDFIWSYNQRDLSWVVSHQYTITPRMTNEARASYSRDYVDWGDLQPDIPSLQALVRSPQGTVLLQLPGITQVYPYENNSHAIELLDNLVWTRGREVITVGAGVLLRGLSGFNGDEAKGIYTFSSLARFWNGTPDILRTSIDRRNLSSPSLPSFDSEYVNRQYFLFAQESFRATSRLLLNYGLRYEYLGAPRSVASTRDTILELGQGPDLLARLRNSTLNFSGGPNGYLYQPDNSDFAVRMGFSYILRGGGTTLFRGSYGIFYDRPFDNLWLTVRENRLDFAQILFSGAAVDFTQPVGDVVPTFAAKYRTLLTSVPNLTLFEPHLRSGYAQDIFLGIEQRITPALIVSINGLAALGRRLLTNDTLGYNLLFNGTQAGIPAGQLVTYRGSQGLSDYYALTVKARYRRGRGLLQAAYTWSHSIDNQSDPLGLDLTNFGYTSGNLLPAVPAQLVAGFATPMDSRGDRGNSDFDERHNMVVQASFDLPASHLGRFLNVLSRDWTIAGVGAIRSGFPYTVWALGGMKGFIRANIINPSLTRENGLPVPGGETLLNPAAFSGPGGPGEPSGRNAFTGPGLYNFDLGVSRAFVIRKLPESSRLILRADFFNVLNHANLNSPYPVFGGPLGVASFGLNARPATFPTPLPLAETPRQILLSVRLRF
jgi:hypothetical protein